MIGTVLKDYQITGKIREGIQGDLYQAVDVAGRPVAVEVLSEAASARAEKRRAFVHGAKLQRAVRHSNVLRVLDVHDGEPFPFVVFEFFAGELLKTALWKQRAWVSGREFFILRQLGQALRACHDQGILHGDVRPENVLVNELGVIRLFEFSLARRKTSPLLAFLKGARPEGSPLYMSPEQIRGKHLDFASDVYSFGVLAYELLTKRPPFLGTTVQSVLDKHLHADPPPLEGLLERVDPQLETLLKSLLSKDPAKRPTDWTRILFELTRWERKPTQIRMRHLEPRNRKSGP